MRVDEPHAESLLWVRKHCPFAEGLRPNAKATQEVQAVRGEENGPEVLFIGQTMMHEHEGAWKEVRTRAPRRPVVGDFIGKPPGLNRRPMAKGFKILEVGEQDDEEPEVLDIGCVECEPSVCWRQKKQLDKPKLDDHKLDKPKLDKPKLDKHKLDDPKLDGKTQDKIKKPREEMKIRAVEDSNLKCDDKLGRNSTRTSCDDKLGRNSIC